MFHELEMLDPEKHDIHILGDTKTTPSYSFYLPSLKGRTFKFEPGLNVIVGANGSGKTSLINLLRNLTWCTDGLGSACSAFFSYELLKLYEHGLFSLTRLHAQYALSTFNLHLSKEIKEHKALDTVDLATRFYYGRSMSSGESRLADIQYMMRYLNIGASLERENEDERKHEDHDSQELTELLPHQDFQNIIINPLREEIRKHEEPQNKILEYILEYYQRNRFVPKDDKKMLRYAGFTALMDEPDAGLDVYNLNEIIDFLADCPAHFQIICSLHNIAAIKKLREKGNVNFIELSEGYLDAVRRFA